LDNITEELEETETPAVYDDYKFLTLEELQQLGLSNLIGTSMLRAYMHGYFCDARLYNKAKALMNPFAYDEYRKKKIKEKMDEERTHRVIPVKKLPSVNRQLAQRLLEDEELEAESNQREKSKAKKKAAKKAAEKKSLLRDDRFRALFENPEFELDPENEDTEVLNPVMSTLNRMKNKATKQRAEEQERQKEEERMEFESKLDNEGSNAESPASSDIEELDDEEQDEELSDDVEEIEPSSSSKADDKRGKKIVTLRAGEEFRGWKVEANRKQIQEERMASLGDRLHAQGDDQVEAVDLVGSAKEMTFTATKKKRELTQAQRMAEHIKERRRSRRPTRGLGKSQSGGRGRRK